MGYDVYFGQIILGIIKPTVSKQTMTGFPGYYILQM